MLDSAYYIGAPIVKQFEEEFGAYIGGHCVGTSNGTDAIFLGLEALGVGEGDEVITQANTYTATVFSISRTGATPVLVDVDPHSMMMDVSQVESKITSKTKCILPVHLYGHAADMTALMAIADKHNVPVLEDTSQAHGATIDGQKLGSFGQVSCFSFYPGKNLGGYGDAGGIIAKDAEHAKLMMMLRNMGQSKKYYHDMIGYNHRLDSIQAAVLSVRLKHLDAWNARRGVLAAQYIEGLKNLEELTLPSWDADRVVPVWHLFVIRIDEQLRDALHDHLREAGVGVAIHYPIPIHETGAYQAALGPTGPYPVASSAAKQMISLPIHPDLSDDDQQYVIDTIKAFCANS